MSRITTCPSCERRFRVPDAPGRYRCPECQTVPLIEEDGIPKKTAEKTARSSTGRLGARSDEQRLAAADIRRIENRLKGVRGVLAFIAIFSGINLLSRLIDISETGDWLGLILNVLWLAVLVVGAVQVVVQPVAWTLLAALTATPAAYIALFEMPVNVFAIAYLLVWIFLWCMVYASLHLRWRLREQHPNLEITRTLVVEGGKLRRVKPQRAAVGRTTGHARQRRRSHARSRRGALIAVAASVLGFIGVILVIQTLSQPPAIDGALADFRTAWNDGSKTMRPALLARFYPTTYEDRMRSRLRRRFDRFGWTDRPPRLAEPRVRNAETGSATVRFDLEGGGELTTYWSLEKDGGWKLKGIRYPEGLAAEDE